MDVDLLITGGTVVTMDARRRVLPDGLVAVKDRTIVAVGDQADAYDVHARRVVDASGCLVTPGLVDVHNHPIHFLSKGLADDLEMSRRSHRAIWPFETSLTAEEAYVSAACTFLEMLSTGTTCFSDPGSNYPDAVARAACDVGIRGVVACEGWDVEVEADGKRYGRPREEVLAEADRVVDRWHGAAQGRLRASYSLVRPAHVTDELCKETAERATERDVNVQAHLHVWPDTGGRASPPSDVARYDALGLLAPNLLLVHLGSVAAEEIRLLRSADVKVAHCPSASMLGGFGAVALGTFPEMIDAGLTIGLGTDAAAISRFLDLVRVTYLAACAHKDARADPETVGCYRAFEMATVDGARALRWEDEIGSLEVGKRADVAVFDASGPEWYPTGLADPVANLVYSASGASARTVVVDGEPVMVDRQFPHLDDGHLLRTADRMARDVHERIGAAPRPRWPASV